MSGRKKRAWLAEGIDPVQDKRRAKAAAVADDAARFEVVATDWQKRQSWTPAVRRQYERMFRVDINPSLGRFPVAEVDIDQVQLLVDPVAKRGKVVAGHVLLLVRGVLSHAVTRKLIPLRP